MLNCVLALATAGLLILAFPRFDFSWLAPAALAPLLVACAREADWRRRFLAGWLSGIVYWFGVCYWIQFVLAFHGGMGETAGWAVFLLFCLAKGLHTAVFAALAGFVMRRWYTLPAVAGLWVALERTHGPLGFAWLALGNAGIGMSVPLRLAPIVGVYGLSFVFAMMGAAVAHVVLRRPRRELAWLALLPLLYLLPPPPEPQKASEGAVMIQPNLSETAEWHATAVEQAYRRLTFLSFDSALDARYARPRLVLWPEVPAPLYYYYDARFRDQVKSLAAATRVPLLFGTVAHTAKGEPLNSALMLGPDGEPVGRYDKMYLVPFGEFVPPFFGFVNRITQEAGDFAPGRKPVVFQVDGRRIGAFICYESAFPHLVRRFAAGGAELLVNLSNDGYFGRSSAREQHLKLVRMRAVENRRWILRDTNDGITATIDPAGRVLQRLEPYREVAARTGFNYISSRTVYTRFGDWFCLLCAVGAVAALAASQVPVYRPAERD